MPYATLKIKRKYKKPTKHKYKNRTKRKYKKTLKRGGGIWANLTKNINIFKKDPVHIKRAGRETDLRLLLSLYSPEEWRMVKQNLLAMSTKPLMQINENDNIFKKATNAQLRYNI